jgi:membrane protein DedA with SNARE-associated domain
MSLPGPGRTRRSAPGLARRRALRNCNIDRPQQELEERLFPDIFHWFIHDARLWVTTAAQAHPLWCFPIAFAIAFSESFVGVSFIVPGTIMLVTLGGVIGASHISLLPALTGTIMGSVLGDWISWWIGFHYHHKIVHFWLFRRFEDQIEKALQLFHRWGSWAIFIGRFMGPLRATVPLVAGMSELEFRPFMIANTVSAIVWAYVLLAPVGAVLRHFFP